MSELLEKILSNINMNAAYKRVCANNRTSEVDKCSQGDFPKGVLAKARLGSAVWTTTMSVTL